MVRSIFWNSVAAAAFVGNLAASTLGFAQSDIPALTEGCTFQLTAAPVADSIAVKSPWLRIPDAPDQHLQGVGRSNASPLKLIKNTPPANPTDPKSFEVKSGDAVFIRTTGGQDNFIWLPRDDSTSSRIHVNSGNGSQRSVLAIRKVLTTNPPTFAPDGEAIHLGDYVLIRDTAAADRRLRLDGINNPVWGVKDDDDAIPFRIADLVPASTPGDRSGQSLPPVSPADKWIPLGSLDGPECIKLEWRKGWLTIPSPTVKHGPHLFNAYFSYDKLALQTAGTKIVDCGKAAAVGSVLASIVASPGAAQPTFAAAFAGCLSSKGVASNLIKMPEFKIDSECHWK